MSKLRVLIVDESTGSHDTVKTALPPDSDVICVMNGNEALDMLESEDFDLMLLELKLPDMDGMEILREVKKLTPKPRVIVLSTANDVEKAVQVMKSGATDYVVKPVEPEKLRDVIREALRYELLDGKFQRPYWL
jgi:DNA-binding response OmpR family regulator